MSSGKRLARNLQLASDVDHAGQRALVILPGAASKAKTEDLSLDSDVAADAQEDRGFDEVVAKHEAVLSTLPPDARKVR